MILKKNGIVLLFILGSCLVAPLAFADTSTTPVAIQPAQILTTPPVSKTYTITVQPGSLKATLNRLASKFGWNFIWQVPNDYMWTGTVQITGKDLPDILTQLLNEYPVQANFY